MITDAGWFTFSTAQSFYLSQNVKGGGHLCFHGTGYVSSVQEAGSNLTGGGGEVDLLCFREGKGFW